MSAEKTLDLETAGTLLQVCLAKCWNARVDLEHTEAPVEIGTSISAELVFYVKTVSLKGSDDLRSLAELADEHGLSIEGSAFYDSMVIR